MVLDIYWLKKKKGGKGDSRGRYLKILSTKINSGPKKLRGTDESLARAA
jgi:hypothetical protein